MTVSTNRLYSVAFLSLLACQIGVGGNGTADQLNLLVQQGHTQKAIDLARRLDEHPGDDIDLTLPLARLARSLERAGEIERSAEFYNRAIVASERISASNLPAKTIVVLRLAAGSVLVQSKLFDLSVSAVTPVLETTEDLSDRQRKLAVSISLQAGGVALAQRDPATASRAYALAIRHADEPNKATAMLGQAWATVLRQDQPTVAATKLKEFYSEYPSHDDAPHAAVSCVECYRQAGDRKSADSVSTELLNRWPDSSAAIKLAGSFRGQEIDSVPNSVQNWLIDRANANELETFDATLCVIGIRSASKRNDSTAWSNLVAHLAKVDLSGQATSDLLSALPASDAERLAAQILSPADLPSPADLKPSSMGLEATVRWAARTKRWSMLASASETQQPGSAQTVTVERLFAESLMQLGRVEESHRWWVHLVDVREVDDFSTLLRCAEVETAVGDDTEIAGRRIAAAQLAAGEDGHRLALANLLAAELQIRHTEFDAARATLESVVRTTDVDASIRGRAQWTLGETYYLQRKFVQAIDAYRRVEGIDGENGGKNNGRGGQWVSAALVQAGKSFEQLGRTRDAALCYGNLLNRFPESAHAAMARQRMASLGSEPRHTDSPNSTQTIRR